MNHPMRRVRTLQERLNIIQQIEDNPKLKRIDIARRLGIAVSTLNSIYTKKNEIREQVGKCGKSATVRKSSRESNFSQLEKILIEWCQQMHTSNIPIDGNNIREQGKIIAKSLGIEDFTASNGWITRFKSRHGLVYKKFTGERLSVDPVRSPSWISELPKLLEMYDPKDIYNAEETSLYYNCLPNGIKGESCLKASSERLTILFCVNSDGSDLREPLVIGKSLKPRCFKNTSTLPVKYYANDKACMTVDIFSLFLQNLDDEMRIQGRSVLLFIDDRSAHLSDMAVLNNVKVVLYPTNCASALQPLDLGIIKCFKGFYRKQLLRKAVSLMDSGVQIDKTSLKIDILQAMHYILTAWRQVKQTTVENCFKKCGFSASPSPSSNHEEPVSIAEDDWNKLEITPDINFDMFVSFDDKVANSFELDETAYGDDEVDGMKREGDDCVGSEDDSLQIPSFAEACMALETLKYYLYSHKLGDVEKSTICDMEKLVFRCGDKVSRLD